MPEAQPDTTKNRTEPYEEVTMKRRLLWKSVVFSLPLILVLLSLPGWMLAAERLSVSVPKANIRSGPGTDFDVLWEIEQYWPGYR